MILTSQAIIETNLQERFPLIDPFDEEQIEGGAYDVRIGKVFTAPRKERGMPNYLPFLGKEERYGVDRKELLPQTRIWYGPTKAKIFSGWLLAPLRWYWITTFEEVNVPLDYRYLVLPRLSWNDMCVLFQGTAAAPGYRGSLTFAIYPLYEHHINVELGARIAQLELHELEFRDQKPYGGPRQGGKALNQDGKPERAF